MVDGLSRTESGFLICLFMRDRMAGKYENNSRHHDVRTAAPMRFRKLRIAWSVAWGLFAVLLIVMWVRSYWYFDLCERSIASHWFKIESFWGQLVFKYRSWESQPWALRSYPIHDMVDQEFLETRDIPKFELKSGLLLVPYWLLLALITIATRPSLPARFSLRTLLIATTLATIMLGFAVYLLG
jgi:hypothetical protein